MWEFTNKWKTFVLSLTWYDFPTCSPRMFVSGAPKFLDVPIILAHSGGLDKGHQEAIRVARECPDVYLVPGASLIPVPELRK